MVLAAMDPYGNGQGRRRDGRPPASPPLAMEFMPRITRAQSMDVLSSQANLARLPGGDRRRRPNMIVPCR